MYIYILALVVLLFNLILIRGIYEVKHFKIVNYCFSSKKIKEELKFIFISDLHCCEYGNDNIKLINRIKEISPDFIIIGGDLIVASKNKSTENAVNFLEQICKNYDVYYTFGNHETRAKINKETYKNLYDDYLDELKKRNINIHFLNNKSANLSENNINIIGLELNHEFFDRSNKEDFLGPKDISDVKKKIDMNYYNILVAHNPLYFKTYAYYKPDLVLSGHNHGNIIHIPFLGGLISPRLKLFDKYEKGIYNLNGSKMVLSAGLGTHSIKFRLFNKPELVVIKINNKNSIL